MSGEMGAVNQMWLNEGGVATIIPLKVLEKIWPVTYDSRRNGERFVIHTNQGNIIVNNNSKGMPYLKVRDVEAEVVLLLIQTNWSRQSSHGSTGKCGVVHPNGPWEHGRVHAA